MASKDTATIAQDDILLRCVEELRMLSRSYGVPIAELLEQFNLLVSGGDTRPDGPTTPSAEIPHPLARALAGAPRPIDRSVLTQASVPLDDRPPEPGPRDGVIPNDRYSILELCGEGGMSQVYKAFDRDLNRVVALKAIDRGLMERMPSALARFIEEAQTTAQLEHPGIVPVHDIGLLEDGRFYFTMKVVSGRTFGAVARAFREASTESAWGTTEDGWNFRRLIDAFHKLCQAVAYAHGRGVLHRDLKPENVMIDAHGEVVLMDWGIAKVQRRAREREDALVPEPNGPVFTARSPLRGGSTSVGAVTGTPYYMSPEQARGANHEMDERSDVYSLGAILYELLAGERPYTDTPPTSILKEVQLGPPRSLRGRERPIPEELIRIQEKAMSQAPADRYADAEALSRAVADWLDGVAKQERADKLLEAAELADARADELGAEASRLRLEAETALKDTPTWASEDEKGPAWTLEDRAAELRHQAGVSRVEAEQLLLSARASAPDHPKVHAALAKRHAALHRAAELARDVQAAARAESFLREYALALPKNDPARKEHVAYLEGKGRLSLVSDPPADAALYRLELKNRRLVPAFDRELGRTPFREIELPHGRYVIELRAAGHDTCRYPVRIDRLGHWDGVPPGASEPLPVRLLPLSEVDPDVAYIPGGPFWFGGDPEVTNTVTRRRLWLDPFLIQRTPVTNAHYLRFLNALVASGRADEAEKVVPRERAANPRDLGAMIYVRAPGNEGSFALPDDARAERFTPDRPVTCVTYFAAAAYTRWLAETTGEPWRLPSELEWEKAARGVDERFFPWGDFFDPSWLCMRQSHRARPGPAATSEFPGDTSIYGVRGLAGNVRDWCLDIHQPEIAYADGARVPPPDADENKEDTERSRVVRGGSWSSFANNCRLAFRFFASPYFSGDDGGFRPARSL